MTTPITPIGTKLISARLHATRIAENLHAVYWLKGNAKNDRTADYLMKEARNELEKLAALFGAKLVEIEPEQEPEPLDAETVAVRKAMTEQAISAARRGHLLGD